jgi:hypothetical protein
MNSLKQKSGCYITMDTGEHLKESIKEWIGIDNEMKVLQAELKLRRQKKKQLSDGLIDVLKKTGIDGWDTKEGKLEYCVTKTKTTINKEHIRNSLSKFIQDEEQIDAMTTFIYESRGIKEKESIKRKPTN